MNPHRGLDYPSVDKINYNREYCRPLGYNDIRNVKIWQILNNYAKKY